MVEVEVVELVVVDVVVLVVLVVDDVVVLDDAGTAVVVREGLVVGIGVDDVDAAEADALARVDVVELHPVAPSTARAVTAISRRSTPDTIGSSRLGARAVASGVDELGTE